MCGLAGTFSYRTHAAPQARTTLEAVRDAMIARGPDGSGLWFSGDERVGLAHRRLSIIDLSDAASQPMACADGRYHIVFNGEIYNYQELRSELIGQGAILRTQSDTEVVLQMFAREGTAMLGRLRGMFAIAIWDDVERSLTLARDPYGIKPLYYADQGGRLSFASQVRALLRDPAISRTRSAAGLAGFHLFGAVPEPFTLFEGIRSLPAGSWMQVTTEGACPPVRYARIATQLMQGDGAVDVATALRESVAAHLVADVEVGAFLSGGVDSGAIVGLMRDCGQERISACTLRFEEYAGTSNDETPRAIRIAQHYGVRHHIRTIAAREFEDDFAAIGAAMDQPTVDGINSWFVSKATHEMGLKVALSGLGGDELFGGYSTFASIPATYRRFGWMARVPGLGSLFRQILHSCASGLAARNPKLPGLLLHAGSWPGTYLLRRGVCLPEELGAILGEETARNGLEALAVNAMIEAELEPDPGSDAARVTALESCFYMRNQLLRDSDWAGMAHSLEIRVPLVDFTLLGQLGPGLARFSGGVGKEMLANAPSKPLPREIVETPKTGFQIPTAAWRKVTGSADSGRTGARRSLGAILEQYDAGLPEL